MLVMITFAALDGPRLVTIIVKLKLLDTGAEPGDAFKEIPRSAIVVPGVVTVVTKVEELLAGVDSLTAEVMVAELVIVPAAVGLTVTVIVPVALLARLDMLHVTIPLV